ncbi:nucleoside triphosphate pyrophosphohydrolase [Oceanospirillum linum]|uniref:Nucleoside triphosphate pyrophosphohydrolase n=1 Tax=Oceanospirillum linum TaxID=966 RepID=A0A1T1HET7_OCELI|nr:nucleoside triphosphate pyrophosphohydrolase [Oceanospirillum linum]OOV88371.1 nucleoside triphosphate pyrophosphohydrolase [Oceanospirillum linum]SEF53823.1 ATP diphosphatase [Oleiphilus messinensis]SMP04745.1 ATP diphosphatase [Oceanospirillum linum]
MSQKPVTNTQPESSENPGRYSIKDLTYLMARLRDPENGCPWDKEQTFATIVPYTLEEAYEVADTIEREDWDHLKEELGDLLFQVIYYSQMADEKGWFNLDDVADQLVTKMVRRHPHVFAEGKLYPVNDSAMASTEVDKAQVSQRWEEIKAAEKANKAVTESTGRLPDKPSILADIPVGLPALTRAAKIQKKASKVGFDWPDIQGVLEKVREELEEVEEAVAANNLQEAQKEFGDLLFAATNLSRYLKKDPESALRGTNRKFEFRFAYVELQLQKAGLHFDDVDLKQMDLWWDEAKLLETQVLSE